jgi:hypothetical protein
VHMDIHKSRQDRQFAQVVDMRTSNIQAIQVITKGRHVCDKTRGLGDLDVLALNELECIRVEDLPGEDMDDVRGLLYNRCRQRNVGDAHDFRNTRRLRVDIGKREEEEGEAMEAAVKGRNLGMTFFCLSSFATRPTLASPTKAQPRTVA